ncbi:nucleobase:cation symporter-2 family protein [Streptomyces sp. NPDC050161]|uniref:nucleobase:cation symporter-2 family protein n=1 Tax=Streptomyces sp. NPDC050161 TaxID=3365604 RepID=UPI0037AAFDD6
MEDTGPPPRHPVDRRPPWGPLLLLGAQHVLVMYTGSIAVPLLFGAATGLPHATVALLIDADLLVAGVVTLLQSVGVGRVLGVRLPIVAGAGFSAVSPMILIAQQYGMAAVYGAMLAGGVFGLLVAAPFARLARYFPPLVGGTVITVIGLSLLGVGTHMVAGDDPSAPGYAAPARLVLAGGVLALIVVLTRLSRGFIGQVAVLVGMVAGTLAAFPLGQADFSQAAGAPWLGLPEPFHFGAPHFPVAAVVSMCVVMLVIFTESTASMLAVAEMTDRPLSTGDLGRGLAADGLSGVLAAAMNSFPDTVFAENLGLVEMTRVRSRWVTAVAGALLIVLGCVPRLGSLVASLPDPVVGAAALVMFAMVAGVGIRILRQVAFDGTSNLLIVAVSLVAGMVPVTAPHIYDRLPAGARIIVGSAITCTAVSAFTLNLLFNHAPRRGRRTKGRPGEGDGPGTATATRRPGHRAAR